MRPDGGNRSPACSTPEPGWAPHRAPTNVRSVTASEVPGAALRVTEEHLSVTLRGNFNPAILHPQWFAAQDLISADAATNAQLTISHPEISEFSIGWVTVRATDDTLW